VPAAKGRSRVRARLVSEQRREVDHQVEGPGAVDRSKLRSRRFGTVGVVGEDAAPAQSVRHATALRSLSHQHAGL
jgi:hypothetical protein